MMWLCALAQDPTPNWCCGVRGISPSLQTALNISPLSAAPPALPPRICFSSSFCCGLFSLFVFQAGLSACMHQWSLSTVFSLFDDQHMLLQLIWVKTGGDHEELCPTREYMTLYLEASMAQGHWQAASVLLSGSQS